MSTLDILDDSFPHGTPAGYRLGCRTAACPAILPCRTVQIRYAGDFTFAKRLDSGMTLAAILDLEAEERTTARAARRATPPAPQPQPVKKPATRKPATRRAPAAAAPRAPRPSTPKHPTPKTSTPRTPAKPHPGYAWLTRALAQLDDYDPTRRDQRLQDLYRYREDLDHHIDELAQWKQHRAALRRELTTTKAALAAATTATRAGISVGGTIERALEAATQQHQSVVDELASSADNRPAPPAKPRAPRKPRPAAPRQLQPHGTNACRARGCDRPECIEAARIYHNEWMQQRRTQQIPLEHHGTAYGYQLGCKDRQTCPAEIPCADASLAEERRRRREAGIPEQAPRVPADPIRQHIRQLMSSGLGVLQIAEAANVSKSGVKTLLYGRSGARKGELPREIEAIKAQRLLALTPSPIHLKAPA